MLKIVFSCSIAPASACRFLLPFAEYTNLVICATNKFLSISPDERWSICYLHTLPNHTLFFEKTYTRRYSHEIVCYSFTSFRGRTR